MNPSSFPVLGASELPVQPENRKWLIESLWPLEGVGIIGGAAKSFKTWLALDLAVSVASGTQCLGQFDVCGKRRVMVYAAEDSLPDIRLRLASICTPRGLCLNELDLGVISIHQMHLDTVVDYSRLQQTIASHRPSLLVLDPFIRLHSAIDENSSGDVSTILGRLRSIQRQFHVSIALVHHARKHRAGLRPGQALRGSTDFHAWTDVTLYMQRHSQHLEMSIEHRSAASPDPILLNLIDSQHSPHLAVMNSEKSTLADCVPQQQVKELMKSKILMILHDASGGLSQVKIREILKTRNQTVSELLKDLQSESKIKRTAEGWTVVKPDS